MIDATETKHVVYTMQAPRPKRGAVFAAKHAGDRE
jgi:hypothetical protein